MAPKLNSKLTEIVDNFYVDIVDDFKEAEGFIINESRFTSIFKKKNYDRNIKKLRSCKKKCILMPVEDIKIDSEDTAGAEVLKELERARYAFNALCDAHIQMQTSLQSKANGTKTPYKEYRQIWERVQTCRTEMNNQLHELDIVYTDYTFDEDADPYEFL